MKTYVIEILVETTEEDIRSTANHLVASCVEVGIKPIHCKYQIVEVI